MGDRVKKAAAMLAKYKYVLLVLLLGVVLLLIPHGTDGESAQSAEAESPQPLSFSVAEEERRLEEALSQIDGAGEVSVLLSVSGGVSRELALNEGETLVIRSASSTESVVPIRYVYPEYTGAVVICSGADNAAVRLSITEAVSSVTGLGSNKIKVLKMK